MTGLRGAGVVSPKFCDIRDASSTFHYRTLVAFGLILLHPENTHKNKTNNNKKSTTQNTHTKTPKQLLLWIRHKCSIHSHMIVVELIITKYLGVCVPLLWIKPINTGRGGGRFSKRPHLQCSCNRFWRPPMNCKYLSFSIAESHRCQ